MTAAATLMTIDIAPLYGDDPDARRHVATAIDAAASSNGFFYVSGHGLGADTVSRLEAQARAFFALPEVEKAEIAMARAGKAWRGWFPLGGELTSGVADQKEGIYFGDELNADDPRVRAGWLMHGANLWPERPAGLRAAVETYVAEVGRAAAALIQGVSLALGLAPDHFAQAYLARPTTLFRIFRYPPAAPGGQERLSFPLFYDPDFDAVMTPAVQVGAMSDRRRERWDGVDPKAFAGRYGDYLESKVGKVFPGLGAAH